MAARGRTEGAPQRRILSLTLASPGYKLPSSLQLKQGILVCGKVHWGYFLLTFCSGVGFADCYSAANLIVRITTTACPNKTSRRGNEVC